jgi:O-antigen/teichoic acid export membrane protein
VLLVLLGNATLRVWLRRSDVSLDWQVWALLAVLGVGATWCTTHSDFLWIMDRLWVLVGLVLVNGAVTVALTWSLAPRYGLVGAYAALGAGTLLLNSWMLPLLARPLLRGRAGPDGRIPRATGTGSEAR